MTQNTTQLSAQELNELQAELDRKKATLSLAKIGEAETALETFDAEALVAELAEIASQLPDGSARNQLQNTVSVFSGLKMILNAERDRNERTLAPAAPIVPPMMPPVIPPAA